MINIVKIIILFEFKLGDFKNQLKVKRKVHSLISFKNTDLMYANFYQFYNTSFKNTNWKQ